MNWLDMIFQLEYKKEKVVLKNEVFITADGVADVNSEM